MNPAAHRSRQKNAAAIVRYLIKSGEVSRTELASVLGLSTATVTNIVTDLIRSGLVYESGSVGSALGSSPLISAARAASPPSTSAIF